MKILDRFTRDRQSRFIWGGVTASFLVLTLLALGGGRSALSREESAAQAVAVGYTDTVLFDALDAELLSDEINGPQYRDLIIEVYGGIMTDEDVVRVRIWSPEGTLLFSTESLEQLGATAESPATIDAVAKGQIISVVSQATVAGKPGLAGSTQQLYQTFSPIRVRERTAILGVAEIDRRYAAITEAARQPWRTLQIGLAAATILCALLLLLSLRRSTSTIGRTVGIVPPRSQAASEPVPDDRNALRLRNELEREREANRRLNAELAAKPLGDAPAAGADGQATRLAEAEWALAEAGAHTVELEAALAQAQAEAVPPEALATLEERIVAAEARAREAELRLQDLSDAPERSAAADAAPSGEVAPTGADGPHPPDVDASAPEAMDLRSRLARSAARKKLGSHVDDEPGA